MFRFKETGEMPREQFFDYLAIRKLAYRSVRNECLIFFGSDPGTFVAFFFPYSDRSHTQFLVLADDVERDYPEDPNFVTWFAAELERESHLFLEVDRAHLPGSFAEAIALADAAQRERDA